jgi:hypothetical protein
MLNLINTEAGQRNALLPALEQYASQSQQGRSSAGTLAEALGSLALMGGIGGLTAAPAAGVSTDQATALAGGAGPLSGTSAANLFNLGQLYAPLGGGLIPLY